MCIRDRSKIKPYLPTSRKFFNFREVSRLLATKIIQPGTFMKNNHSRRDFIQKTALAAGALPFLSLSNVAATTPPALPPILVFSKHLQCLDYNELAEKAKEIGFDGIDLTVRPGGHVLPGRVKTDLPKAVEAIKKAGLKPLMMTTAVEQASGTDEVVLRTAAELGIKYYRMNWYKFSDSEPMPLSLIHI